MSVSGLVMAPKKLRVNHHGLEFLDAVIRSTPGPAGGQAGRLSSTRLRGFPRRSRTGRRSKHARSTTSVPRAARDRSLAELGNHRLHLRSVARTSGARRRNGRVLARPRVGRVRAPLSQRVRTRCRETECRDRLPSRTPGHNQHRGVLNSVCKPSTSSSQAS